jgi:hypothetical protein
MAYLCWKLRPIPYAIVLIVVEETGERKSERELILKLHQTKEDLPSTGIVIDATQPLEQVVDEIIKQTNKPGNSGRLRPGRLLRSGLESSSALTATAVRSWFPHMDAQSVIYRRVFSLRRSP